MPRSFFLAHPGCSVIMPGLVNTAPSLRSLAVSHKQVPFVLSLSQHSIVAASVATKAKRRRRCQSATGELLHSMPKKCKAFLAFVKEVLPAAAQDSDEEEASSSPPLSPSSQANGGYCLSPSRSKSVSGELSTASPSPSHSPRNPDQRQQHQRAKLALRSMSEPEARVNTISSINIDSTFFSSPCADECEVLRAYREALWFHASLQNEYDSTMRLFILHRYGRLRSLIRKATLDQQLRALREGLQCKCSCRSVRRGRGKGTGAGRAASVDEAGSRLDELMSVMKPMLDMVTSYFKTAFAQIGRCSPLKLAFFPQFVLCNLFY